MVSVSARPGGSDDSGSPVGLDTLVQVKGAREGVRMCACDSGFGRHFLRRCLFLSGAVRDPVCSLWTTASPCEARAQC